MPPARSSSLKRALTDQRIVAGNAYADEILLRAKLSPFKRAGDLSDSQAQRPYRACRETLEEWVDILGEKAGDDFPVQVTALHDEMGAHGKFG